VYNKFFELIIPVATFLTGTLSGIMLAGDDKDLRAKALDAANKPYTPPPAPPSTPSVRQEPFLSPVAAEPIAPFIPSVAPGFGGKEAPAQPQHPEI
jgi:hypothetical protein